MDQKHILSAIFRLFTKIVYSFALIFLAILGGLWYCQEQLLFLPHTPSGVDTPDKNPEPFQHPGQLGMNYEEIYFMTSDGIKLHGWLIKQENYKDVQTLLFFQGNAGNIGLRLPNLHRLFNLCSTNLFIISYRGYGYSEGTPSEEGLYRDAKAALDYLLERSDIDSSQIFIFGRSMGGAVALDLAWKFPEHIRGVIVENTFTSLRDMIYILIPFIRLFFPAVTIAQRIYMNSIDKVPFIITPVLYISGAQDTLVPPHHVNSLYDASTRSTLRKIHVVRNGTHNTTWRDGGTTYFNVGFDSMEPLKRSDVIVFYYRSFVTSSMKHSIESPVNDSARYRTNRFSPAGSIPKKKKSYSATS